MSETGFTSLYDNVFERLAVSDTTSSARKKSVKKPLYGSQSSSRPHTPSSLYSENPSFSSNQSSRKVKAALFDRLASTETFATAKMKGKVPEKKRSSSTPRKTSNAFFERMAYTETFASAQMKGLINNENENDRAVSRGRSVKSAKSTRTISRGRARETDSSFFDRMAKTDTYASAHLKGKYHEPQASSTKPKYTPNRSIKSNASIFDRLARTQTKSTQNYRNTHTPVTPDPAKSMSSTFGRSKNYTEPRKPRNTSSFASSSYSTRKFSSNTSVGSAKSATSAKSAYTSKSIRSAASVRSAYTAPSTRTATTMRTAATTKSSASSRTQSLTSSYHSERTKPVLRTPRKKTPLVKASSPTPEYLRKISSSQLSGSMKKSFKAPQTAKKSFKKPSKETSKPEPAPAPRPVLHFESDDELSFGDDSEEEDFLAAPSRKAAPQDAESVNKSEEKDSQDYVASRSLPMGEEKKYESPLDLLAVDNSINVSFGTDDEDDDEKYPEEKEEFLGRGAIEAESTKRYLPDAVKNDGSEENFGTTNIADDVPHESEDGSRPDTDHDEEFETMIGEPQDEPSEQEEYVSDEIKPDTTEEDACHESEDGLSIGSEVSADELSDELEGGKEVGESHLARGEGGTNEEDHDDIGDVEDELGDLLDSQSDSPQLSVQDEDYESNSIDVLETQDTLLRGGTDSLNDVLTDDDLDLDEEDHFSGEDDPLDQKSEEGFDENNSQQDVQDADEEMDHMDSLDLVLDATGDYDDDFSAECEEPMDEEEIDDLDNGEEIEAEGDSVMKDEVGELMDEEEYLSEGGEDQVFDDGVIEHDQGAAIEETNLPAYKIIKSEKYHPENGFEEINPEEIFLTETLLAFEDGEISNREMAVLLIEALFENNFENGDHWDIDPGTARELEEDEGGGGDLDGRAFVVKRQARLDWNDLYSVAAAKGSIIICPDENEIRVENYSYFVAG